MSDGRFMQVVLVMNTRYRFAYFLTGKRPWVKRMVNDTRCSRFVTQTFVLFGSVGYTHGYKLQSLGD